MKLDILYKSDVMVGGGTEEENRVVNAAEAVGVEGLDTWDLFNAYVAKKLGIGYSYTTPIDFYTGNRVLHFLYKTVYPDCMDTVENVPFKDNEYWSSDDFLVYRDESGSPVLYMHYVHGDCGATWFTIDD